MLGNELINENPEYQLLKNNCQIWAENFLQYVCPNASLDEKSIAELLPCCSAK